MPSRSYASPDDIEMFTVFEALKKGARKLILLSLAAGALTFGVLALMAPRYQSEAELAIVAKGAASSFSDPRNPQQGPDLVTTRMDKEAINTHVKSLQSPELLEKIADDLKLKDRREFNSALGPIDTVGAALRMIGIGGPRSGESDRDRVLSALRSSLEVYSAKESRFIGVRVTTSDADLAAAIANAIAEDYRASLAEQGVLEIDDQQAVLKAKIDKLTPEVAAAETEASRYRGKIDGFRGGAQNTGLNEQQMSELTAELTRAKAARGEADARAKSAREMMKLGSADALPDVQKSPLIQNLVQQRVRIERQISELSATLLPGHPRMKQLAADLAGLKKQLNAEIGKLVDSLGKEAKVAQGREDSIQQSLTDLKARVVTNAPEEARLRQFEATAKAKRTELDNLQAQLESNRKKLDARAQPVEAQVISKAQPSSVPVFPKKIPLFSLVAVATMMLGTAAIVTKALFHGARGGERAPAPAPTLTSINPVSLRADPVLEAQPSLQDASVTPLRREVVTATVNESTIPAIARRLAERRNPEGGHRTLITGEGDGLDTTEEATELAKVLAAPGVQVLLIEWSPRGESLVPLDAAETAPGFNELLAGEAGFEQVIQRLPRSTVHVIAAGREIGAEQEVGGPEQINLVLDALDEAYEHIIVTGRHAEARTLFEVIEGRFDAGVIVSEMRARSPVLEDPPGTFLGFEVADIDVIRYERRATITASNQRIARAMGGTALMTRGA